MRILTLFPVLLFACTFAGEIEPDIACTRSCDTDRADCETECETECVNATGDLDEVCDEDCRTECDGKHTDCSFECGPSEE